MSGDKIWLRLPAVTLAVVDQRRGEKSRSEALREMIDHGLTASPSPDMPVTSDDGVTCTISSKEAWAIEMAAWLLEVASASWQPMGGVGEVTRWIVDVPTNNQREWSAWAAQLRQLHARHGGGK
jgi:hypothetical protein